MNNGSFSPSVSVQDHPSIISTFQKPHFGHIQWNTKAAFKDFTGSPNPYGCFAAHPTVFHQTPKWFRVLRTPRDKYRKDYLLIYICQNHFVWVSLNLKSTPLPFSTTTPTPSAHHLRTTTPPPPHPQIRNWSWEKLNRVTALKINKWNRQIRPEFSSS